MNAEELLAEILEVFPPVEMPAGPELTFHAKGCHQCAYLAEDIENYRGKPIDGEAIRFLHQELSLLSAKAWRWIAPHYLSFCLTPEAEYNGMETEYLIYNLGPDERFREETLQRLSGLNKSQIGCLIHFMEWLASHPDWSEYCPENINKAIKFLSAAQSAATADFPASPARH
jgi:hypothetical protein